MQPEQIVVEIKKFGWEPYYNEAYFVNSSIIPDDLKNKIDYTKYGVTAETAYLISTNKEELKLYIEGIRMFLGLSMVNNLCNQSK